MEGLLQRLMSALPSSPLTSKVRGGKKSSSPRNLRGSRPHLEPINQPRCQPRKQEGSTACPYLLGGDSIGAALRHFLFLPADPRAAWKQGRGGPRLSPLAGSSHLASEMRDDPPVHRSRVRRAADRTRNVYRGNVELQAASALMQLKLPAPSLTQFIYQTKSGRD